MTRCWLCLQMPPPAEVKSESLLQSLMQRPLARESWEVGGNCNFMIAAARLGLQVAALGNLGNDVYGRFLRDVLQVLLLCLMRPFKPSVQQAELSCVESTRHDSTLPHSQVNHYSCGGAS